MPSESAQVLSCWNGRVDDLPMPSAPAPCSRGWSPTADRVSHLIRHNVAALPLMGLQKLCPEMRICLCDIARKHRPQSVTKATTTKEAGWVASEIGFPQIVRVGGM